MTYWNNRPLTATEELFREQHRCIACGTKVQAKIAGNGRRIYPFECPDCATVRTRRNDAVGHDFGPARASIAHAANAAMGYSTTDCGVLGRTADPTTGQDRLDRDERGRLKVYQR